MKQSWLELSNGRFFNVYCTLAFIFLCLSIKSKQNPNYNFNNNHILKIKKLHFFSFQSLKLGRINYFLQWWANSLKTCSLSATTLLLKRIGVSSRGPVVRWVGSCLSRCVDLFLAWFVGCWLSSKADFFLQQLGKTKKSNDWSSFFQAPFCQTSLMTVGTF